MKGLHIDSVTTAAGSWWASLPYGGHTEAASAHVPRMSASKFGRLDVNVTAGEWGVTARDKMRRAMRTRDNSRVMVVWS